jgi:hypothetical protein
VKEGHLRPYRADLNPRLGANDTIPIGINGAGSLMGGLLNADDKAGSYQIVAVSDVYAPNHDAVKERSNGLVTRRSMSMNHFKGALPGVR